MLYTESLDLPTGVIYYVTQFFFYSFACSQDQKQEMKLYILFVYGSLLNSKNE